MASLASDTYSTATENNSSFDFCNATSSDNGSSSGCWNRNDEPTASWWLLHVGTLLLVFVGLPGNVLTLVVMKSRQYRHKSYSHYFCALAIFDSLVLINKALLRVDSILAERGHRGLLLGFDDTACRIHGFAEHVCYLMTSWLVVCLTADRFLAVFMPLQKDLRCRSRHAITITVAIFTVACCTQLFRLFVVEIDSKDSRPGPSACIASESYMQLYLVLHIYLYQFVLQFLMPTVLIAIGNIAVLCFVRRQRGRGSATNHASACRRRTTGNSFRATAVLMAVSFTYIVTLLPLLTVSVTLHIALKTDPSVADRLFRSLDNVGLVLELVSELNYASNFYIYVLTAGQFRRVLRNHCRYLSASGQRHVTFSDQVDSQSSYFTARVTAATNDLKLKRMKTVKYVDY